MERNENTQGSSLASHSFNTLHGHEALNEAFIVDMGQFVFPDQQWEGMHTFWISKAESHITAVGLLFLNEQASHATILQPVQDTLSDSIWLSWQE